MFKKNKTKKQAALGTVPGCLHLPLTVGIHSMCTWACTWVYMDMPCIYMYVCIYTCVHMCVSCMCQLPQIYTHTLIMYLLGFTYVHSDLGQEVEGAEAGWGRGQGAGQPWAEEGVPLGPAARSEHSPDRSCNGGSRWVSGGSLSERPVLSCCFAVSKNRSSRRSLRPRFWEGRLQ